MIDVVRWCGPTGWTGFHGSKDAVRCSLFAVRCSLFALAISLIADHAVAGTLLSEPFGDNVSQTCSSPWYGDCESGWTSNSANDSLDLCSVTSGSTTDWGMGVKAATLHNGAGYSLSLGSTDEMVVVTGTATAIVGSVDVGVRLVFKDSSGSTVGTVQNVQTVGVGDIVDLGVQEPKPNSAVSVEAQVAVAGTVAGWPGSPT
jgi:hypothetical protein